MPTQGDENDQQECDQGLQLTPSPNFQNMKKFLKSRSSNEESSPGSSSSNSTPTPPEHKIVHLTDHKSEMKAVVQPPLPTYPPPSDCPLNIRIKQEKEDVEDENEVKNDVTEESSKTIQETEVTKEDQPAKIMCKEWLRGDCTRPVCRYTHEIIVSQLRGVFTFCWNYQNAACTYPNCKFVHANVFEEAGFYRSGYLPQKARAHLRRAQPTEESRAVGVANPKAPHIINHPNVDKAVPINSAVPASNMAARQADAGIRVPRSISPFLSDMDQFSGSPSDLEPKEHVGKVCKNCEVMEFRVQYRRKMINECIQAKEELNTRMNVLNKKTNKLSSVLLTLMKPSLAPQAGGVSKTMAGDKLVGGQKETMLMEQLSHYVGSNNRLIPANLLGSLLAKLLYRSPEQIPTPNTSREA